MHAPQPTTSKLHRLGRYLLQLGLCLLAGVLLGSLIILAVGSSPLEVYSVLFREAFLRPGGLMIMVQRATPLILSAAAAVVAFQAGAINTGLAGQFLVGTAVAAMAGYALALPKPLHIAAILILCGLGGAGAAFIPAIFRRLSGVSEVITGIIANLLMSPLLGIITGSIPALRAAQAGASQSGIRESAQLPQFSELTHGALGAGSKANLGFFVAIAIVIALAIWMRRSTLGYAIRMSRANSAFAEFAGIDPTRCFFLGMMLSGAIAAMAGATEILGIWRGYRMGTVEVGDQGLVLALVGGQSYIGSLLAALAYGGLEAGGLNVAWSTPIPKALIDILVQLLVISAALPSMRSFFTSGGLSDTELLGGRFIRRRQ